MIIYSTTKPNIGKSMKNYRVPIWAHAFLELWFVSFEILPVPPVIF